MANKIIPIAEMVRQMQIILLEALLKDRTLPTDKRKIRRDLAGLRKQK